MALVDGHGNFGSIEGDGAAAMRYTEARLEKFAQEVYLKDLTRPLISCQTTMKQKKSRKSFLYVCQTF